MPEESKKNTEVIQRGLDALTIADDSEAGVTVCYGTDLLVSMHALQTRSKVLLYGDTIDRSISIPLTEEFVMRSKVLPSSKILKHATTNAAKLLGLQGKVGVLMPGAFADLIVSDANPFEDIAILDDPNKHLYAVIKQGHVFCSRLQTLQVDVAY